MEEFLLLNNYLKKKFGKNTFDKWIKPLSLIGKQNNILFLGSPDKNKIIWLNTNNLLIDINKHSIDHFGFKIKIIPLFDEEETVFENQAINDDQQPNSNYKYNSNLIKKFTFESFIQTESNQFAFSFAHNVSDFPGKSYNPLYIYSDVGLGKTHLLNAIGNKIYKDNNKMKIRCLTSSELMYEFSESSKNKKRNEFITKFESLDVLLIDDIQYITKWAGTKEQFFNIFNKLINMEKQIVLCSDVHPNDIPDLEERFKTRFIMGNIVDLKPYDLEGRLAILNKKIEERKRTIDYDFKFSEEVIFFIAEKITSNIRALEGALNRLISTASLKFADKKGVTIDISFAKKSLEPFINLNKNKVTFDSIKEYISNKYHIKKSDLVSKSNKNDIAFPRQIAMYLCKRLLKCTLIEIGKHFGGKHHTTVLHSIKKVETKIELDSEFSIIVNNYEEYFK